MGHLTVRGTVVLVLLAACAHPRRAGELSEIAGIWDGSSGGDPGTDSRLDIEEGGGVTWTYVGSLGHGTGRTTGAYRDQRLVLSEPMEIQGGIWKTRSFRHLRIDRREYLVDESALENLRSRGTAFGRDYWWGLRRRLPKSTLQRQIAQCSEDEKRLMLLDEWGWWPIGVEDIAFLKDLACDDPYEGVRNGAEYNLLRIGFDEDWQVADPEAKAAADAALEIVWEKDRERMSSPAESR